jgi:uncharacterized protein
MSKKLIISDQLALPLDAVTQTFAFLARKGAGKTYAAMKLCEQMLEKQAQVCALDPVGVWYGLRQTANGKDKGFPIPVLGGLHGDLPLEPKAGALIADLIVDREISAVLDVSSFRKGERKQFVTDFAEQLFHRKKSERTPIHIFLEEAQVFVPENSVKGEERMLGAFEDIVRIGRNYGIGASLISQRPQSINKEVLNQTECLFALQTGGPHERDAIKRWIAVKGVSEDINHILPKLEIGQAHVWSPQWLQISKTVRIARKVTFDASATPKVGERRIEVKQLSPVDIAEINKAMQSVVEKSQADDPKILKQKIVGLERELAQLRAHQCLEQATQQAISDEAERRLGILLGNFKEQGLAVLEDVQRQVEEMARKVCEARTLVYEKCDELMDEVGRFNGLEVSQTGRKIEQPQRRRDVIHPGHNKLKATPKKPAEGVNSPQQAILDALAWFEAVGIDSPSRSNVAAIAGVSPRSSGYRANVSALSSKELILYPQPDCLQLTEEGRAAANPVQDLVRLEDLHQAWLNSRALSQPQKHLLKILLQIYPKSLSREQLADKANVSSASSGFRANVSTLSSLQLVVYPAANQVQANGELLFPNGLS